LQLQVVFLKHMEVLRRKLIYQLFIEQFIEMAKVSLKYRSLQQTMQLLKQANRICLLLIDDKFTEDAEGYQASIEPLIATVQSMIKNSTTGPELPRRLSIVDRECIKIRYRPDNNKVLYTQLDGNEASDDDNDEIYNYHRSVAAQIHATSAENLARFQHTDELDDDIEEATSSIEKLEINLNMDNSDNESETATRM